MTRLDMQLANGYRLEANEDRFRLTGPNMDWNFGGNRIMGAGGVFVGVGAPPPGPTFSINLPALGTREDWLASGSAKRYPSEPQGKDQ